MNGFPNEVNFSLSAGTLASTVIYYSFQLSLFCTMYFLLLKCIFIRFYYYNYLSWFDIFHFFLQFYYKRMAHIN